jgi:ribosomal-protein-serine acetyltransferase
LSTSGLPLAIGDARHLRLIEERDVEELHAVIEANRAHLSPWMPWAAGQTRDRTAEFIRQSRNQLAQNQGFQAAIVVDGSIAGTIGYHRIDWNNRLTSLGYWLAADAQGAGTMTAAVTALVEHAFGTFRLNRVEIHAGVENARSRAIPERLGFVEEGVLREVELVGERFIDHVVYGILAREWQRNKLSADG